MSIRSQRLAKYLENILGWAVYYDDKKVCEKCKVSRFSIRDIYCPNCGTKLNKRKHPRKETNEELEDAMKYALGETEWPKY